MIELIADIGGKAVDFFIDLWINKVVTRLKKKFEFNKLIKEKKWRIYYLDVQ